MLIRDRRESSLGKPCARFITSRWLSLTLLDAAAAAAAGAAAAGADAAVKPATPCAQQQITTQRKQHN
jgi:hypothetical protein